VSSDKFFLLKWVKLLFFWRWPARLRCHGRHLHPWKTPLEAIRACQYIDDPNDNRGEWGDE